MPQFPISPKIFGDYLKAYHNGRKARFRWLTERGLDSDAVGRVYAAEALVLELRATRQALRSIPAQTTAKVRLQVRRARAASAVKLQQMEAERLAEAQRLNQAKSDFWAAVDASQWRKDERRRVELALELGLAEAKREATRATVAAVCRSLRARGYIQTHTSGKGRATSRYFIQESAPLDEIRISDHALPDRFDWMTGESKARKRRASDQFVAWNDSVAAVLSRVDGDLQEHREAA